MPQYSTGVYHSGYMGTAVLNCSGFSYALTAGVPVLTAPSLPLVGIELPVVLWKNSPTATIVKIKNSKTGKNPLKEATFADDEGIMVVVDMDFATPMSSYSSGTNLSAGSIAIGVAIPWVALFLNQTKKNALDGKYIIYAELTVKTRPVQVAIEGGIGISFTAEQSGPAWDENGVLI